MGEVSYIQDLTDQPRMGPHHRVGGYYEDVEALEQAARFLDFDVVVPPKCQFGFYMVPDPVDNDQAAHALIEQGRDLAGDYITDGAHRLLRESPENDEGPGSSP
jgi:hypothetical protein